MSTDSGFDISGKILQYLKYFLNSDLQTSLAPRGQNKINGSNVFVSPLI